MKKITAFTVLFIITTLFSCSATKKMMFTGSDANRFSVKLINMDINEINSYLDTASVDTFTVTELRALYGKIEKTNSVNEVIVLRTLLSQDDDTTSHVNYSLKIIAVLSLLGNTNQADSIFDNVISLIENHYTKSDKPLADAYYSYGISSMRTSNIHNSKKALVKSLTFAKKCNDTTLIIKNYESLNEVYYLADLLKPSLEYYYDAFAIHASLRHTKKIIDLTNTNFNYYMTKGLPLYRFDKQVTHLDSIAPALTIDNRIEYLMLKAKYLNNVAPNDEVVLTYFKELDSLYNSNKGLFAPYVDDYVEIFFPILNRHGKIDDSNTLMEKMFKDYNIAQDSIINDELVNMAFWAYHTGRFRQSQELFKQALKEYEKTYGKESPIVAELLDKIGVMYLSSGLTLEAYNLFDRSLAIKEKHMDGDYISMGISYNNIAESYRQGGEFRDAEANYYAAIESWSNAAADTSNMWLTKAYHNLGVLYTDMGQYDTAMVTLKKAQSTKNAIFGKDSPELIYTYIALGKLNFKKADFENSHAMYKEADRLIQTSGLSNTLYELSNRIGKGLLYAFMGGEMDEKAKENLYYAEQYIMKMDGGQQDEKLRDIYKILYNIAKREQNEKEQQRISTKLYGNDNWDD